MQALDELERRFAEAIEADERAEAVPPPRRRRGWLPLATGGALAALATVGAVVLVVAAGGPGEERRPANAALLERVAQAAEQAPPVVLHGDEVWYVREQGIEQLSLRGRRIPGTSDGYEAYSIRRLYAHERWSGFGTTARTRSLTVRAWPMLRRDRRQWRERQRAPLPRPLPPDMDVAFTRTTGLPLETALLSPQQLRDLPSDPDALLETLAQVVHARGVLPLAGEFGEEKALAAAQFATIRSLLALPVTPQQRAGLLRAFVRLPGARVYGMGRDRLGRPGLVLTFLWRNRPEHVVVRASDGWLLETRGPRGGRADTVVEQVVAASVRALPEGVEAPKKRLPRTRSADAPAPALPGLPPLGLP